MKQFLPTSNALSINKKGFTLIELMVVVTIIAILAVIGISIYANAQKNARDGIRRAEITSLGKSIESAKDPTASNYIYTDANFTADHPQNKPKDPLKSSAASFYCIATSTLASPAQVPATDPAVNGSTWPATANCPSDVAGVGYTAWVKLVDNDGVYYAAATNFLAQSAGVRYWKICTRLEVSGAPFCVTNLR